VQATKLWLISSDPYPDAPALAVYYLIDSPSEYTLVRVQEATGLESLSAVEPKLDPLPTSRRCWRPRRKIAL
jgi:hypothetical protein